MEYYTFNKKTLSFDKVNPKINHIKSLILTLLTIFVLLILTTSTTGGNNNETIVFLNGKEIIINESDPFTEGKLISRLKELNLKYPWIALAQAKLETGNFKSRIFIENNNLFGMREARLRVNLAKGTQYAHAFYSHWYDSVLDYAFWVTAYGDKCKNEDEFFQLLDQQYAEATNYVEELNNIIEEGDLRNLFDESA